MKNYLAATVMVFLAIGILLSIWLYDEYTSYDIVYSEGNQQFAETTKLKTVGAWLDNKEIKVEEKDILIPEASALLEDGLKIELKRANTYKIADFNRFMSFKSQSTEVSVILAEAKIELNALDYVTPELDASVKDGDRIKITRVETIIVNETVDIPYSSKTYKDASRAQGTETITQYGELGKRQNSFVSTYENGKFAHREQIDTAILKKPVDELTAVGTYVQPKLNLAANTYRASSSASYTLAQFKFNGIVYHNGNKFSYYSQSVLPGDGLYIPGRHISSAGFVSDGDGYIVLAGSRQHSKGEVIATPFGAAGKIYDRCPP